MPLDGNGTDSFTITTGCTSQTFISSNVRHRVKIVRIVRNLLSPLTRFVSVFPKNSRFISDQFSSRAIS